MAISKIVVDGRTIMDVTQTTVSSNKLLSGNTAVDKKGDLITGSAAVGENVNLDWAQIKQCVNEGVDPSFLPIGTQLVDKWTWQGTTYNIPWIVVHYNKNGMYFQSQYILPDDHMWDNSEAFYYVGQEGLQAGTYYFSIGVTISKWTTDKHIQFTLSQPCEAGDQFLVTNSSGTAIGTNVDPTSGSYYIRVYGKGSTILKQQSVISDGTDGVELGSTSSVDQYHMNGNVNALMARNGLPTWSQSAVRQWLNSDAPAGQWWTPQNPWDRPPTYAATVPGFLSGFSEEFKSILEPVPVVTILSSLIYPSNLYEVTQDKVFLPSLEEMYSMTETDNYATNNYGNPRYVGDVWEYWRQKAINAGYNYYMGNDRDTAGAQMRKFKKINSNNTYYNTYYIRSPRYDTSDIWSYQPGGYVSSNVNGPSSATGILPAFAIKKSTPYYSGLITNIDWAMVKNLSTNAGDELKIGSQITDSWAWNGTTYQAPWDIVHYDKDGMYLQWHYTTPDRIVFDEPEALYYVGEDGLSAGTYYISIGYTDSQWTTDKHIQFTLTQACDPGDQFCINVTGASTDPTASRTITVYGFGETTVKQTATTSDGTDGIELGSTSTDNLKDTRHKSNGNVNGTYLVFYGNRRWSQSAIRQWLNSDASAGQWWTPMNPWDRPPSQAATVPGFLSGYSNDIMSFLSDTEVKTVNVYGDDIGSETTYDKIFLPSGEQLYTNTGIMGEGDAWMYYKNLAEEAGYVGYMSLGNNAINYLRVKYRIDLTSSAADTWLRSQNNDDYNHIYYLYREGYLTPTYAKNSNRCCPACKISLIK